MLRFAENAVEQLASYIDANYAAKLAQIETDQGLTSGALGRPGTCDRADMTFVADPRDGLIEVYETRSGPESLKDTSIHRYHIAVAITLLAADGDMKALQLRFRRWESAWWLLMGRGANNLGGTVGGCLCSEFSKDSAKVGSLQVCAGVALVQVLNQESAT